MVLPEVTVSVMYVMILKFVPGTVPTEITRFEMVDVVPQNEYVNGVVIAV